MKKLYVKPEMDIQEFIAEDMIMNGSFAGCTPFTQSDCGGGPNSKTDITLGGDINLDNGCDWLQAALN